MAVDGSQVLITGATRGIGAAFVDAVLERGADLVYAGARNVMDLAGMQQRYGDRLVPVPLDMTVPAHADAVAELCPDVDLLICNAGKGLMRGVLEAPDEAEFRAVFETNFFGPTHLVRAMAPALRRTRGSVLFVHSTAAFALSRSSPVYSASKAAALMMSLGLREELRAEGVRIVNVFPGFVATAMSEGLNSPKASPRQIAERSLDGVASGATSVFPDRFSELVAEHVGTSATGLLDEPREVMNGVVGTFLADPLAGH
jgi:NAD(P)-dependent dehydrogenase (short-subunit alcohol dehydrogenase family)